METESESGGNVESRKEERERREERPSSHVAIQTVSDLPRSQFH